jgi:hypothetical protein
VNNTPSESRFHLWATRLADMLGAFAAVWAVAVGVLLVGLPIALIVGLILRLTGLQP